MKGSAENLPSLHVTSSFSRGLLRIPELLSLGNQELQAGEVCLLGGELFTAQIARWALRWILRVSVLGGV